jgi:transcriptional regulator with XRE-family HTH domain
MKTKIAHPLEDQINEIAARIGRRVRIARKRRGWTQLLMAEKIGVSAPTYRDFEAGRVSVSIGLLISAMLVLGVEEELLHLLDPEEDKVGIAAEKRLKRVVLDNDF